MPVICVAQSLESLDNGKPFAQALGFDVEAAISWSRYYAGAADKIVGQTIPAGIAYCFTVDLCLSNII